MRKSMPMSMGPSNVEKTDRSSGTAFAKPAGIAAASMPQSSSMSQSSPSAMSTPTAPAVQNGGGMAPKGAPGSPFARGSNPDNMLPPSAFHKPGRRG